MCSHYSKLGKQQTRRMAPTPNFQIKAGEEAFEKLPRILFLEEPHFISNSFRSDLVGVRILPPSRVRNAHMALLKHLSKSYSALQASSPWAWIPTAQNEPKKLRQGKSKSLIHPGLYLLFTLMCSDSGGVSPGPTWRYQGFN